LGLFNASKHNSAYCKHPTKRNTATPVSQATQTFAVTASRAIQTDAATISLWDLLPKARKEAYDRSFNAGKGDGHVQSIKKGNGAGLAEGLATRFEQGQAEGLKMGLEQSMEVELQRGIKMGKELGYTDGLIEGIRQAKEEIKKLSGEDSRRHKPVGEVTREKIVVKLPPAPTESIAKKRKDKVMKPKSNGVDPFASLLGLVLKK
jgi:hypothetical protein